MNKLLGLSLALCLLMTAGLALGGTIHVPTDYPLIHDAVQACPEGDTVLVAPGTYTDCTHETEGPGSTPACVIMKTGVTLRGSGKDLTVVSADSLGRGIFVENVANCRIENLQVTFAFAEVYGGGILLRHVDDTVEMNDLKIFYNHDGGIICINEAHPIMRRIDFIDNVAKQGGGLAIEEDSNAQAYDCFFNNNKAPSGAGIIVRQNSNAIISGCRIQNNIIDADFGNGGGIFVINSSPTISDCEIVGNITLGNGGGVSYQGGLGGTLSDCLIEANDCANPFGFGGGVYVGSSNPTLSNLVIVENTCTGFGSSGGGIAVEFGPSSLIENCTIAGNSCEATGFGGGVFVAWSSADPVIDKCIIADSPIGSGLYCDFSGTPTVSCTDVYGNAGGDALCGTDGGGNFSSDPLFCGVEDPDKPYGIGADSPCAPGNHPGGAGTCDDALIGALPAGCGTGVGDLPTQAARLLGNAPNPFNPKTTIHFVLDQSARTSIRIYDIAGRGVASLHLGELPAGRHQIDWNGRLNNGQQAPSGVYFYELDALGSNHTKRMTLIK